MSLGKVGLLSIALVSCMYATNGFVVTYQGAKASAMADAFIAQADDPTANYYNAAGLTALKGTQISTGLIMAYQTPWEFEGSSVGGVSGNYSEEARSQVLVAPHIYFAQQIDDNWYMGLGINASYPLSVQWHTTDKLAQTSVYQNNMLPLTINPNVAYKFDGIGLSIGAGVSYTYAFVSQEYLATSTAGSGANVRAEIEGGGFGYNLGAKWDINDALTLAATYRSKVELDLTGDGYAQAYIPGPGYMSLSQSISTKANLPAMYVVGVAYKPIKDWLVEVDVGRTEYSSYKNYMGQEWEDTWSYRLGAQYTLNSNWDLRFGYAFEETPVPDAVVGADLPDGDNQTFSTGFGYHKDNFKIDLSAGDMHRNKRSVNNAYQVGSYELDVPFVQATFTWKF